MTDAITRSRYDIMQYKDWVWSPVSGSYKGKYLGVPTGKYTDEGRATMLHLGPGKTDEPPSDATIAEMMKRYVR